MATSFEAMMTLAREKAQANQAQVEATIRQKEYKDRERRAKQEENERKEREMEAKLRQRHFENLKKEEERKRKEEKQRVEAEAARQRREAQIREEILHGKKSAPRASGGTRTAGVKRSRSLDADSGNFLTREEKRARKESAFFDTPSSKATKTTQRPRAKLPGGALNQVGGPASSSAVKGNTRQRLMKAPNTLVKLNQVKRDTRTIDEIVTDLAHKRAGGAQSNGNTDFFGNPKSKNTSQSSNANARGTGSSSTMASKPRQSGASARPAAKPSRRDSRSQSPPRRRADYDDDIGHENITDLVRGLYGRRGASYNPDINVYSDDEDMEADFLDVHAEEERSARLAREEDARALAEEKRHEEEKRRKKMASKR